MLGSLDVVLLKWPEMPKRAAGGAAGADSFDIFTAAIEALHVDGQLAASLPLPTSFNHVLTAGKPLGKPFSLNAV